jgi:hypothetical protein
MNDRSIYYEGGKGYFREPCEWPIIAVVKFENEMNKFCVVKRE